MEADGLDRAQSRYGRSITFHERAKRSLARGVGSAMRASHEPVPLCITKAKGSKIYDADGNEYLDFVLAYGPLILGHSPGPVIKAVKEQLARGLGYGAEHTAEVELAEAIARTVPSVEKCVLSNTGTEAVQAALRIARAYTGRQRIIKFRGHYHGWVDSIHVGVPGQVHDGPGTGGQDPAAAATVTLCDWNDHSALDDVLSDDVAAVIMEPICVNGGGHLASDGYVAAVKSQVQRAGSVLIFDEVITGYRTSLGGAQQVLDVEPDLTVLGKALGAGFPISAVGGARHFFDAVADGRVAHMGNFNANPISSSAALAAVTFLEAGAPQVYQRLESLTAAVAEILTSAGTQAGLPLEVNFSPGVAFAHVTAGGPVMCHEDRLRSDVDAYACFARCMLDEGVHLAPRGLVYVSTRHGSGDLDRLGEAASRAAARTVESLARRRGDG